MKTQKEGGNNSEVKYKIEQYRQWRRREDRKWAEKTFPQRWLHQFELHHSWYHGRVLYFLRAKKHRERDKKMRIVKLMTAEPSQVSAEPSLAEKKLIKHRDKRYKRLIRNKEVLHRYERIQQKGTKKLYLASGNEHGLAWQLAVNISAKRPKYEGTFYMAETKSPHTQKTIHLAGGAVKGCEWQLAINVSADQEKLWGNFYMRDRR